MCTPSPVTLTLTGPAPATTAERASSTSSHSICVTPLPPVSVPATLTFTDAVGTQPAGMVGGVHRTRGVDLEDVGLEDGLVARVVDDPGAQRVRAVGGDVERVVRVGRDLAVAVELVDQRARRTGRRCRCRTA